MLLQTLSLAFLSLINHSYGQIPRVQVIKNDIGFVGAVFEYAKQVNHHPKEAQQLIEKNLEEFNKAAKQAASQGADIIVFPEDGIFPTPIIRNSDLGEWVPDPKSEKTNPCLEKVRFQNTPVLANLSCLAKVTGIYLVANTAELEHCVPGNVSNCPQDGIFRFNTDVVFNRQGELVARHRKRFLFFEDENNRAPMPELTFFDTEFGRFGVVICFDTMFGEAVQMIEKYNVDTVIVSTYWFDELPFLSAIQFFQSFAVGNGVNLLVANIHKPITGTIGSLIVSKDGSTLKYTDHLDGKSKLLITKIPGEITTQDELRGNTAEKGEKESYKPMITNFENYTVTPLDPKKSSDQIVSCNNYKLCCILKYNKTSTTAANNYYLAAFDGLMNVKNRYFWYHQVCSFFSCEGQFNSKNYKNFTCKSVPLQPESAFEFYMFGNMTATHIYPSVMASNKTLLSSASWKYNKGQCDLRGSTGNQPLIAATLYGRRYELDPPYKQ